MASNVNRRGFLGGLGAVTILGLAGMHGRVAIDAAAVPPSAAGGAIDVHGHALPGFWVEALRASGSEQVSGMAIPDWTPETAVRFLNRHCIDTQIVSLPDPAVTFLPALGDRVEMARRVNDYFATELVEHAAHPGRFGAFATLPLADLSLGEQTEAISEARRAVNELGLDGVSLLSNYGDTYLGDPQLAPLLLALNSLGAVVAVHPNAQGTAPESDLGPALLESPFNTTRAIVNMSYLQTFTLYPNIRWLFVDAGGVLPYLAYRTSLFLIYPVIAQNLGLDLWDLDEGNFQFGNLYFDTAWSANAATIASLREIAPTEHILLGTDWPLSAPALPEAGVVQPELPAILGADDYSAASRLNALTLLPAMAARTLPGMCSINEPGSNPNDYEQSPTPSPDTNTPNPGDQESIVDPDRGSREGLLDRPDVPAGGEAMHGMSPTDSLPDTGARNLVPLAAAGLAATTAGHAVVKYAKASDRQDPD